MASSKSLEQGMDREEEPGRLIRTNLELTYDMRQLAHLMRQLKGSTSSISRKKYILDITLDNIPTEAIYGGIIIVPEALSAEKVYKLPFSAILARPNNLGRGYEFDIRNDSKHNITIARPDGEKRIFLDGPDVITANSGSRWYVNIICVDNDIPSYEVTRLN